MSCPAAMLPRPESLDLALLTCTEKGAPDAHSYSSKRTHFGGRSNTANMCVGGDRPAFDTTRSAGASDSSRPGEEDAPPQQRGEDTTSGAKEFARMELRAASIDAERPYARGPHRCPICPTRQFAESRRLRSHKSKDHDAGKSTGAPSSRVPQMDIALFNRGQILCASGSVVRKQINRWAYLERAGHIVAAWMRDCGDLCGKSHRRDIARLDRHLRLCLTTECRIYFPIGQWPRAGCRTCGYTYYATGFAGVLFSLSIRPEIKGASRDITESLVTKYIASGCAACFLLPSNQEVYISLLEDIVGNSPAWLVRGDVCSTWG